LLLDTIADDEELSVSDNELRERIVYQAQRRGVSPNEYAMQAHESGELGAIYADVRRGKALVTVVRQVIVTDGSGNIVDIDALSEAAAQA
jgi:trigger factor